MVEVSASRYPGTCFTYKSYGRHAWRKAVLTSKAMRSNWFAKARRSRTLVEFDDRSIHFIVVLWSLTKALGDKTCLLFAMDDRSIRVVFILKGPSDTYRFTTGGESCALKSLSSLQTVESLLHGRQPHWAV